MAGSLKIFRPPRITTYFVGRHREDFQVPLLPSLSLKFLLPSLVSLSASPWKLKTPSQNQVPLGEAGEVHIRAHSFIHPAVTF